MWCCLNDCEHNKEIIPDISPMLFVMFACEDDLKTVFWAFKTFTRKGTQVLYALPLCCYLDPVANILLYQNVKYGQDACIRLVM